MKVDIKKLSQAKIEILVEIPWLEFEPYLDKAAQNLSQDLKFKGFRKGKVPGEILEREIGQGKILAGAGEICIKQKYPKIVLEKKLEVIGSPQVEILKLAKGNPFSFRVRAEILPEIRLPDYGKIVSEVEKKQMKVEEKEIKDALNFLAKSRAKFKDLEKAAEKGDFLEIEYQSPQIEQGKVYQDRFELGKGQFVPGFEQNLRGMKTGEKKEFKVIFPAGHANKNLVGQEVKFEVKVKKVMEAELPQITDEFAKSLGKFENLDGLKKNLAEGIKREKEIKEVQRWRGEILEKIVENSDFEVPQVLMDLEKDKKRIENFLILRAIGKKEKVEVSEEEIEKAVNQFLQEYPAPEKAKKEIDPARLKEYYKGVIYNEKVFQKIESFSNKS